MVKSVIKELILVLLLCLAIILVLGILLYKYVPLSKTLPSEVAYTIPAETKEELAASEHIDDSQIVMTYTVNASDLNNFQRTQNYKPGKANPFAAVEQTEENQGNANSGNGTTNNNQGSNNNNNLNSNGNTNSNSGSSSSGQFFQNTGTK